LGHDRGAGMFLVFPPLPPFFFWHALRSPALCLSDSSARLTYSIGLFCRRLGLFLTYSRSLFDMLVAQLQACVITELHALNVPHALRDPSTPRAELEVSCF
jgi:hypothetical protein